MKKATVILLLCLLSSCEGLIGNLSYEAGYKRLTNFIKTEYEGIVVDTYSPRENLSPTHFKITYKGKSLSICPTNSSVMKNLKIGDSIAKPANENYIYIYDKGEVKKMLFMKIPVKYRQDSRFPKEWKGKWLESN